jgi:hypothetical protein
MSTVLRARAPGSTAPTGGSRGSPSGARPCARRSSGARARCPASRASTSREDRGGRGAPRRAAELPRNTRMRIDEVVEPLAQRRDVHLDDGEAEVEILAEARLVHLALEVAVRRADDAHVHLARRVSPTRRISRASRARRSFGCSSRGSSPTSSRNTVPPSAASKAPTRSRSAPVNAAADVAEQLALDQVRRDRAAVDDDERLVRARSRAARSRSRRAPCPSRSPLR